MSVKSERWSRYSRPSSRSSEPGSQSVVKFRQSSHSDMLIVHYYSLAINRADLLGPPPHMINLSVMILRKGLFQAEKILSYHQEIVSALLHRVLPG